jgi:hypothetical protein
MAGVNCLQSYILLLRSTTQDFSSRCGDDHGSRGHPSKHSVHNHHHNRSSNHDLRYRSINHDANNRSRNHELNLRSSNCDGSNRSSEDGGWCNRLGLLGNQ